MSKQKIERRSKSPNRGKSKTPTAALVRRTEPGSHGTKSSQNFVANAQSATPSITEIEKRPSGPVDPPNTKPVISKLSVIRDRKKTLTLNSNKVTEFP